MIAGDIIAGRDFDRFARKVQCRGNVGFSGIYQISRYSNNIGLRLSQHIKKSFIVFADFGVVQIRNMRDFAAVKRSGQPLARNRVFVELQRRVAPNYPKNQRRKQSRDDREGDYRLFLLQSSDIPPDGQYSMNL